jgi:broad specificity phosphatase PhoE
MGFLRRILTGSSRGEPGTPKPARAPNPAGEPAPPPADAPALIVLVLHGEHSDSGELTLQGSIQAGFVADALAPQAATGPIDAVFACERPGCRGTADLIAGKHDGVEASPFEAPGDAEGLLGTLEDLQRRYAGRAAVVVVDETLLHRILSTLEGLPPEESAPPHIEAASITRLKLRPDLSYSLSLNDTEHLDGVTKSDRFRML